MAHTGVIGRATAPELHIMSLNIRRPMPHLRRSHPDRWDRRAPFVGELLATEQPTLLGLQEALPEQRDAALAALGGASQSGYRSVGTGRGARGGDESCPLLWDTARLDLLDWEQRALSDSPETPGSRSWGNPIPRIVVVATFRDLDTRRELRAINTHLDPFSPRSRGRSASAIRQLVDDTALPTVVMGDFNTGTGSAPFRTLTRSDLLRDSWTSAEERVTEEWGTYPNYRSPRPGARIDWILTTRGLRVTRAAVGGHGYLAGPPSDHLPVHAVVEIGSAA